MLPKRDPEKRLKWSPGYISLDLFIQIIIHLISQMMLNIGNSRMTKIETPM